MKKCIVALIASLCIHNVALPIQDPGIYKKELKELKKTTPLIFDKHANATLRGIAKDTQNCKELGLLSRIIRSHFLLVLDGVVVTAETMPQLYGYVNSIAQKQGITTPTVFIPQSKGFFNAAALKLFASSGGIIIGQDVINESSDNALEGVIAHEMGHIFHNHNNKILATGALCIFLSEYAFYRMNPYRKHGPLPGLLGVTASSLIIGKRFEKQADRFAYEKAGKGTGIIEFFELQKKKEQKSNDDFDVASKLLTDNRKHLSFDDYLFLNLSYYYAKTSHTLGQAMRWVYHHTPFGPHPSHDERIQAAKNYLASQA